MTSSASCAAAHVRDTYPSLLETVAAAGATAASTWGVATGDAGADATAASRPGVPPRGRTVRQSFRTALRDAGALERLPTVLASTVDHLGDALAATPVAAPPYVVVTSRGVLLRATLDRGRLVVEIQTFEPAGNGYRPLGEARVSAAVR